MFNPDIFIEVREQVLDFQEALVLRHQNILLHLRIEAARFLGQVDHVLDIGALLLK